MEHLVSNEFTAQLEAIYYVSLKAEIMARPVRFELTTRSPRLLAGPDLDEGRL